MECNGKYYTFGTGGGGLISEDGWNWKSGAVRPGGGAAPDAIKIGDRYLIAYGNSGGGLNGGHNAHIFTMWNKSLDPQSPDFKFTEPVEVASSDGYEDNDAIDPGLLLDPTSGRLWMSYGTYFGNIRIVELDPKTGDRIAGNKPVDIAIDCEATDLIYRDGWYYLLGTHGTCCDGVNSTYNIVVGRSKNILGSYLLLRGSDQQSLQQIIDHSIAADGQATVVSQDNGLEIQIRANKQHFTEYFNYILSILQHPSFEQSQFDLIKSQSLASLNRPYTEPETVAGLTMSRIVEQYTAGDLRFHFEPEQVKQQLQSATQAQVEQLYRQFMGFNHAQLSVTGDFDVAQIRQVMNQKLATWSSSAPYQRLSSKYQVYPAQQVHVQAEQREFGHYQGLLLLPVGMDDADAPALQVLSYILGDSQLSSRLGQELREKNHLVYGFSSGLDLDLHDSVGVS